MSDNKQPAYYVSIGRWHKRWSSVYGDYNNIHGRDVSHAKGRIDDFDGIREKRTMLERRINDGLQSVGCRGTKDSGRRRENGAQVSCTDHLL